MTQILINQESCNGCGLCVRSCPYLVLNLDKEIKKAEVRPDSIQYCSKCGHCTAICPQAAITVTYPEAGSIPDVSGASIPSRAEMSRLMMSRRSVRAYKKDPVSRKTFEEIFDVIRYAPTGMNGQSVHWLVIEKPEDVQAIVSRVIDWARIAVKEQPDHPLSPVLPMFIEAYEQGYDAICHSAPHLVFVHSHKDNPIGFIDAIIAMTHLDLIAPVFGLGTCWAGIVQIALSSSPELMKSIGLPQDHVSHYGMMIGYPKHSYPNIPARNAAKVTWK